MYLSSVHGLLYGSLGVGIKERERSTCNNCLVYLLTIDSTITTSVLVTSREREEYL